MIYFIIGVIVGAYAAQKYSCPDVEQMGYKFYNYMKSIETKSNDNNSDNNKNN